MVSHLVRKSYVVFKDNFIKFKMKGRKFRLYYGYAQQQEREEKEKSCCVEEEMERGGKADKVHLMIINFKANVGDGESD